jgi:hypothetical protein
MRAMKAVLYVQARTLSVEHASCATAAARCNARRAIGFVADARRLNVAITRPRRGLVVVGCADTLAAGSPDWAAYTRWLHEHVRP